MIISETLAWVLLASIVVSSFLVFVLGFALGQLTTKADMADRLIKDSLTDAAEALRSALARRG